MKIEAGKYYRTRDGRKVGPAMRLNPVRDPDYICWARFHSGGDIFEIAGVEPEDAFDTRLVSEWTDTSSTTSTPSNPSTSSAKSTPKLWRDMTPEEKGALLLAHHEGKVIQHASTVGWVGGAASWFDCPEKWVPDLNLAYRVKPEPTVEVVTLDGADFGKGMSVKWSFRQGGYIGPDTHRITFNLIDGKPDCASIKMEEL